MTKTAGMLHSKRLHATGGAFVVAIAVGIAVPAAGATLGYGGRLVDAAGQPASGTTDLVVRFYREESGGSPLVADQTLAGVPLREGVFQIDLVLTPADIEAIFGDGNASAFVEISTATQVYPRQRYLPVPFALRVPVDHSLAFDSDGRLGIAEVNRDKVTGLNDELAGKAPLQHSHTLGGDLSGSVEQAAVTKLQGRAVAADAPSANQVLQWTGTAWAPATLAGSGSGTVTTVSVTPPLAVSSATTTPSISMPAASGSQSGYVTASDWSMFNSKQNTLAAANSVANGYLSASDWTVFNSKQSAL